MKSGLLLTLMAALLVTQAWADDLTPEPLEQAIGEYKALENSGGQVDPMNHEIWKLYIHERLLPKNGLNRTPFGFLCSLVPGRHPKRHFYVVVRINNLYNFFTKVPQVGDVIAVEGRITEYLKNFRLENKDRVRLIKVVNFYPENADLLPQEPEPVETLGPGENSAEDSLEPIPGQVSPEGANTPVSGPGTTTPSPGH